MLQKEKKPSNAFSWKNFFAWPEFAPRLAFASVTLILGLAGGYYLRTPAPEDQPIASVDDVKKELSDLKELMMLSLLEKESVTDRLKAVSLTQEMDQASQKVTTALLQTLNSDSDINVRLAALDALRIYSGDSKVRQELIQSIAKQDSPLVQIALAELMAQLQDKSSATELEKILKNENTPTDVKKKIEESLKVLI
jgi:HEAT repeat protein